MRSPADAHARLSLGRQTRHQPGWRFFGLQADFVDKEVKICQYNFLFPNREEVTMFALCVFLWVFTGYGVMYLEEYFQIKIGIWAGMMYQLTSLIGWMVLGNWLERWWKRKTAGPA